MDGQRIFSVADTCPTLIDVAFTGRPFRSELDPATRICGYANVSNTAEVDFFYSPKVATGELLLLHYQGARVQTGGLPGASLSA